MSKHMLPRDTTREVQTMQVNNVHLLHFVEQCSAMSIEYSIKGDIATVLKAEKVDSDWKPASSTIDTATAVSKRYTVHVQIF